MHVKFKAWYLPQSICSINGSTLLSGLECSQSYVCSLNLCQAQLRPLHEAFHQADMRSPFSEFLKYIVPVQIGSYKTVMGLYSTA